MAISLSATFGAFRSLQTFLTTMPSLSASLSALDKTRCAWPIVRAASPPWQGVVPSLNIEAAELLQRLAADVRRDLVFDQLAIALRRPG